MQFGVGDFSGQRPHESPVAHRQLYADLLDQAELIEVAGLDSMWVSEHHFAEDGYMPAVLPIVAAMLARTSRITPASSTRFLRRSIRMSWLTRSKNFDRSTSTTTR